MDAGCRDRTNLNLRQPVVPLPQQNNASPAGGDDQKGGVSAKGVSVTPETADRERDGVTDQLHPDALARQEDLSCAVTGGTSNFSLLLDDGRLLNLDQGGNTLANQVIQSTTAGRAMLNGTGPAMKLRVSVRGVIRGDEIRATKIETVR